MPKFFRVAGPLVLAVAALTPVACDGPPPKPVVFNDRIARNNERWNTAVLAFKKVFDPLQAGQPVKPADAQAAYDALAAELKEVRRAGRHMPAPLYNPTGRDFLAKYQDYLGVEDDILNDELKKVIATVADANLSNTDKWNAIWKIYSDVEKHEKDAQRHDQGADGVRQRQPPEHSGGGRRRPGGRHADANAGGREMTPVRSVVGRVVRTAARALLTLFVLWQFVFLVTSNLLGVEEPLRKWVKEWYWKDGAHADVPVPEYLQGKGKLHEDYYPPIQKWDEHWSQLTGQPEHWSLFAPFIGDVANFPAVELRWDDQDWPDWADQPLLPENPPKAMVVLSDNEPKDRLCYAKFGRFRIRKYEGEVAPYASPPDGVILPAMTDWDDRLREKVRKESDSIINYLRWRLRVYQQANPGVPPPTQVILLVRAFKIAKPPGPEPYDWYILGEHRVARWLPAAPLDAKQYRYVERYDPATDHFERMER